MENKHSLKLIEGVFTPLEAWKVVFDLISSKLSYHSLEVYSISERCNGDVSYAEKRIAELKDARKRLEDIIAYTSEKGLKLEIESFINISFCEQS